MRRTLMEPPPVGAKVWVDRDDELIECTVFGSEGGYTFAVAADGWRCWIAPGVLSVGDDEKPKGEA